MNPWDANAREIALNTPRHVWVRFGEFACPGLVIGRRERTERGGVSPWEGWAIYASQDLRTGEVTVSQGWTHGDLIAAVDLRTHEGPRLRRSGAEGRS